MNLNDAPIKILILAADPTRQLELSKEIREIQEAIRGSRRRDLFKICVRPAASSKTIRQAIAEEKPQIVHFCGHGLEDGSLLLEDDARKQKEVTPESLALLFQLHTEYVRCVLLNACHSEKATTAISQYISYVIGTNNSIQDKAAIAFAQGFYDGLGYEHSRNEDLFERAFKEAIVAISMENNSQASIPVLKKKPVTTLSEIDVTGNQASEVGMDYSIIKNLLEKEKFGLADYKTSMAIIKLQKEEKQHNAKVQNFDMLYSRDLYTIKQLWTIAIRTSKKFEELTEYQHTKDIERIIEISLWYKVYSTNKEIKDIKEEIINLKNGTKELENEVDRLEDEAQKLEDEVDRLEDEAQKLEDESKVLKQKFQQLEVEVKNLKQKVQILQEQTQKLEQENHRLQQENYRYHQENRRLQQENYRYHQENYGYQQENYRYQQENYRYQQENRRSRATRATAVAITATGLTLQSTGLSLIAMPEPIVTTAVGGLIFFASFFI